MSGDHFQKFGEVERVLGERVHELRKGEGWSQNVFGERMRREGFPTWHHNTVAFLEEGRRHLRLYEGYSMAHIFGIPVRELAFGPRTNPLATLTTPAERLIEERRVLLLRLRELDRLLAPYVMGRPHAPQ
jgi:transcriptional regulator with XRE-family HTH domain